jgi:uncharacterized glyoxalase superfamily protein PhnB
VAFPPACPEIPVADLDAALVYYRDRLGFTIDWADEELGLAGLSQGDCRLFMGSTAFRSQAPNKGPLLLWFNASNREEVDAIHASWLAAGARIVSSPGDKPWKLREFVAEDLDGNRLRVFYDFAWEEREAIAAPR